MSLNLLKKNVYTLSGATFLKNSKVSLKALKRGFQQLWHSCLVPCGAWELPGPGIELVAPALAGGFSTSGPPGKSWRDHILKAFQVFRRVTERGEGGTNLIRVHP